MGGVSKLEQIQVGIALRLSGVVTFVVVVVAVVDDVLSPHRHHCSP